MDKILLYWLFITRGMYWSTFKVYHYTHRKLVWWSPNINITLKDILVKCLHLTDYSTHTKAKQNIRQREPYVRPWDVLLCEYEFFHRYPWICFHERLTIVTLILYIIKDHERCCWIDTAFDQDRVNPIVYPDKGSVMPWSHHKYLTSWYFHLNYPF